MMSRSLAGLMTAKPRHCERNGSRCVSHDHTPSVRPLLYTWRLCSQAPLSKSPFPSIPSLPPLSLVLARPNMLRAWTCLSLLLLASVASAIRNDRQLRHRLKTDFGHKPASRRSVADVAFTVEVIQTCHCAFPSTFLMPPVFSSRLS